MAKKPITMGSANDAATRSKKDEIDPAQIRRNNSATTNEMTKFCRLTDSTKQNYRIDVALETFNTIEELMQLTGCSRARIKSHIKYIKNNCTHAILEENSQNNRIRFVLQ